MLDVNKIREEFEEELIGFRRELHMYPELSFKEFKTTEKIKADLIFGLHNNPEIPWGKIAIKRGGLMAAVDTINIKVKGKGGHGAIPDATRDPIVALIGDKFGLDSDEGRGVLGVYIVGTVFGTIFMGLLVSFLAAATPLHPYSLAMATGVGSASMMTAGVGSLVAMFPEMQEMLTAFGATSNMLSGLDGLYMSLWMALPLSEWLYRKVYKAKYGHLPEPSRSIKEGE